MTSMTHEIMQQMFDNNKSGGLDTVESSVIKNILQKHDPEGFNSFEPSY